MTFFQACASWNFELAFDDQRLAFDRKPALKLTFSVPKHMWSML